MLGLFTSAVQAASESSTTEARRRPCEGRVGAGGFFNLSHRIVVMSTYAWPTEQRCLPSRAEEYTVASEEKKDKEKGRRTGAMSGG